MGSAQHRDNLRGSVYQCLVRFIASLNDVEALPAQPRRAPFIGQRQGEEHGSVPGGRDRCAEGDVLRWVSQRRDNEPIVGLGVISAYGEARQLPFLCE